MKHALNNHKVYFPPMPFDIAATTIPIMEEKIITRFTAIGLYPYFIAEAVIVPNINIGIH